MTEFAQNTKEWLLWRCDGIGASDAPAIMGKSEYRTKLDTWKDKFHKNIDESEPNFIQKKGHQLEAWARSIYIEQTGYNYVPRNFVHNDIAFFRASMDGFCEQLWDGLEVKYMGKKLYETLMNENLTVTERIPPQYFDQIMMQFLVTNCVAITLIGVCDTRTPDPTPEKPDKCKREMFTLRIHNKPEFQQYIHDILMPELLSFWKSVQDGIEPKPDSEDFVDIGENKERTPEEQEQINELKVLLGQYAEMDEQEKMFKNKSENIWEKIKDHPARNHSRIQFGEFKLTVNRGGFSIKYKDALDAQFAWIQSMKLHATDSQLVNAIRNFPDVPNLQKFTEIKADQFKITVPKVKNKRATPEKTAGAEDEIVKVTKTKALNKEVEMEEWALMTESEQVDQARLNTFMHPETGEQIKDWITSSRSEKIKKLIKINKKIVNDADRTEINEWIIRLEKLDKEIGLKLAHKKAKIKADKPKTKTLSESLGIEETKPIEPVEKVEAEIIPNPELGKLHFRSEEEMLKSRAPTKATPF